MYQTRIKLSDEQSDQLRSMRNPINEGIKSVFFSVVNRLYSMRELSDQHSVSGVSERWI
jgi:hypothetical protein